MKRWLVGILLSAAAIGGCEDRALEPPDEISSEPLVLIDRPPLVAGDQQYGTVVVFGWRSAGERDPASIRHLWSPVVDTNGVYNPSFDIIGDLNAYPGRYENRWTRWIPYNAPADSGRSTILGDDETLTLGRYYIFAVQARSAGGAVTDTFMTNTNIRRFRVKTTSGPLLRIYEPYLVGFRFLGTGMRPEERSLPPDIPLEFKWRADASDYGGEVVGYRYGWDIPDPASWDAPFRADATSAPRTAFHAGVHTLFIEAIDRSGARVLGRVTIRIVPFPMDRNLLLIDDFAGAAAPHADYALPSEAQDDEFWGRLCSRANGFDPARDVYDCMLNGLKPPGPDLVGRYKNIVWNYGAGSNAWSTMIRFTPESEVGQASKYQINYLAIFLFKGGHVWTLGQSQRGGGLAAMLSSAAQLFPMSVECEVSGNRSSCGGDRSGAASMAYRDYCVTMLDKVDGSLRSDRLMPARKRDHYDVLVRAHRDRSDPLTIAAAGLPDRLDLWEEVTKPGRRFCPDDTLGPGGLTYVEVYDPDYWMARRLTPSQLCFHPMYRMEAKGEGSALGGCVVALWLAKYADVIPDVSAGPAVAAPSVHFGFPLWFFRRSAADSIADAVFAAWGIR